MPVCSEYSQETLDREAEGFRRSETEILARIEHGTATFKEVCGFTGYNEHRLRASLAGWLTRIGVERALSRHVMEEGNRIALANAYLREIGWKARAA